MAVKKRKTTLKTLKSKLDRAFSVFIRIRDADKNGNIKCYCCGKILKWRESENMHFIPRQHLSLRFSEINCHAGCTRCNHFLNGNIEAYTLHMKQEYGDDIVEKLISARNQTKKISVYEYEAMIQHYQSEANRIATEKCPEIKKSL